MEKFNWLQMFAEGEGGDTGASVAPTSTEGATAEAPTSGEAPMPTEAEVQMARIPERARGAFEKAYKKTHKSAPAQVEQPAPVAEEATASKPEHIPYAELIKGEYKDEHKAYMDKTIAERFKGVDAIKAQNAQMQEALGVVAMKYGLDPKSDNFIETLSQRINADETYIEDYAMNRNMSVEEAKRTLQLQKQVEQAEAREQAEIQRREQAVREQQQLERNRRIRESAEKTKAIYPNFNLEKELENEKFLKLLWATDDDTTAAYKVLHWNEIVPQQIARETAKATQQVTQSIASGYTRPTENGLSNAPAMKLDMKPAWQGMNSTQMAEFARKNLSRR